MNLKNLISLLSRLLVGGILAYAGFLKAVGPSAEFAAAIAAYKILPAAFVTPLSIAMPYIEMWVGLFVLTGFCSRWSSFAAAALFTIFLAVLGSARLRGIDLASCGCFGADSISPRYTMVMDAALLALSFASAKLNRFSPRWSLDRTLS